VDLYLFHRGPKFLGPKEPILVGDHALDLPRPIIHILPKHA